MGEVIVVTSGKGGVGAKRRQPLTLALILHCKARKWRWLMPILACET